MFHRVLTYQDPGMGIKLWRRFMVHIEDIRIVRSRDGKRDGSSTIDQRLWALITEDFAIYRGS
jgi:hypothetical protein